MRQWRAVPGWQGYYEVSDDGLVRSVKRPRALGAPLKPAIDKDGYGRVTLSAGMGRRQQVSVHRVVALAFIGPRPEGQVVRHLNGDNTDNRAANLAYGTVKDNEADKIRHGRKPQLNRTHCPSGHPYDEANTMVTKVGWRLCRECRRVRERARRRRRALAKERAA